MQDENPACFSYEIVSSGEDRILKIDCQKCSFIPLIEDNPTVMGRTVDLLIRESGITKIIFEQRRDYEYDYKQVIMLQEIANAVKILGRDSDIYSSLKNVTDIDTVAYLDAQISEIKRLATGLMREDIVSVYVRLFRMLRIEKINNIKTIDSARKKRSDIYINLLEKILVLLDKLKIIVLAKPYIPGYKIEDRNFYAKVFQAIIRPDFMYTKIVSKYPSGGEQLEKYMAGGTEVTIFKLEGNIQILYHIIPPEFKLSEEFYNILDEARKILSEHKPTKEEFVDPQRMREVFMNIGQDMIRDIAQRQGVRINDENVKELASILVRYTVGFGLIEVLLSDEQIQDVSINSPSGKAPIFLVHAKYGDCITNITPTVEEVDSWASKLRLISGRPLDEANPILDTELELPSARSRVGVIGPPLNPNGIAFSFRRHRDKPWTLPLFIHNKYLNSMAAGIISFIVDGNRTMLVAGTRSAGKTSLLTSVIVEMMRKYRALTIEDTLELPVAPLRDLGFNIQQMKVRSALAKGGSEIPADEGIRTSLRMGDSALIVGEVRSTEAIALYEAMRVGALANIVAGTIHGDSPYGIFDRVVNDLKVPRTSFKATDIIIVANPVKSADGLHRWRRVTQITEVRKEWEEDPVREGGFVDLMKYDSKEDALLPSADLINGDSDILKAIASNVKEWAGNWDAVWDNIMLRANIKQRLVDVAVEVNDLDLLEAEFVVKSNDVFHLLSESVKEEVGTLDSKKIFSQWNLWLSIEVKKRMIEKENANK